MVREKFLRVRGARENNLANLDFQIPHDELVVVTGVSGSGKSTLAFDTLYAEGARRYIETFSPYTRQFLDRLHQPELDAISGVRPALALEQRNRTTSSRSTVGTITEINDYLKVIWANIADLYCPNCERPVVHYSPAVIAEELVALAENSDAKLFLIGFRLRRTSDASLASLVSTLEREGFLRYFSESEKRVERLSQLVETDGANDGLRELFIVVDRRQVRVADSNSISKLSQSLAQSYHFGHGSLEVFVEDHNGTVVKQLRYRDLLSCGNCGSEFTPLRPAAFSFNSPVGACTECNGFGKTLEIDPAKVIPDDSLSLEDGALACWRSAARQGELRKLKAFCSTHEISFKTPWRSLSKKERDLVWFGTSKKSEKGVLGWFEKLKRKRRHLHVRVFLSRYRSESICPKCHGGRLRPEALSYRLMGKNLRDIWALPLSQLVDFFEPLALRYEKNETLRAALEELTSRLKYLVTIGVGYLTLDRQSRTLSGGEHQRVNLTSLLGSRLTRTMIVLDEPTIALHSRDTQRLLTALEALRDRGNTVIVVEHDGEMIRAADTVIDIGPLSGSAGGQIIYQGDLPGLLNSAPSLTGAYLSGRKSVRRMSGDVRSVTEEKRIRIEGARAQNLKYINVDIPLQKFVIVSGVSGSGKSSLIHETLFETYQVRREQIRKGSLVGGENDLFERISGLDQIDAIELIDQSPVGKTPRSNPATYTKSWDLVREALAETEQAKSLGLGKSAFSFNVAGGRCPVCEGAGYQRIEMQFLADVFVECESCNGRRFKDEVLQIQLGGKNVAEILEMTIEESIEHFRALDEKVVGPRFKKLMQPLVDLGLGYLRLGQPLSEVSGGEAQRIKLASHLGSEGTSTLFILDEPTTGLHPHNVAALLQTFDRLLLAGHSIVCVEHNLDLIRCADWIIDLGPGGGETGGELVIAGDPVLLLEDRSAIAQSATLQELVRERRLLEGGQPKRKRSENTRGISIYGAREHNLKNITVEFPADKVTVVTGVSGSGKSTLVFDILFQEGQRRYIDCLSPYARQYITQVKRAEVDLVDSVSPTIAISQKTAPPAGVSTIATTTELYQYLRLLYSKVGTQHCPEHHVPITGLDAESLTNEIVQYAGNERIFLFAPVVSERKGFYTELFQRALRAEITEARIDGAIRRITPDLRLERQKLHSIELLVASLSKAGRDRSLLEAAVKQALLLGSGVVEVARGKKEEKPRVFSTERICPICRQGFQALDPRDFSFRSVRGTCEECNGRGVIGDEEDQSSWRTCEECGGARIGPIGRNVFLAGKAIHELSGMVAPELYETLSSWRYDSRMEPVIGPIIKEVCHRLQIIDRVGLGYLKLDRSAVSISGGEAQRLRLARTLGSPLSGVCYVLDEPTIGLHPQDHEMLMGLIRDLRDGGNSVVVVEHDEETICQADHVIDIGPRGGRGGGELLVSGTLSELLQSDRSVTAQALSERIAHAVAEGNETKVERKKIAEKRHNSFRVTGATTNNLRSVNIEIPYQQLAVVCGVSGSGKSSLVHGTIVPAISREFAKKKPKKGEVLTWKSVENLETLERLVEIDQSPVGKNSASTPASYLGMFDEMRKIFAMLPEAQTRGWTASHFSFNSGKGRCAGCHGKGFIRIPMSFLPEAQVECEQCGGGRYTMETLDVLYQGRSVSDVLAMTMVEAKELFHNHGKLRRMLAYVDDLGLGYLTLGQPTHTLSGGEAQRIKIARELGAREAVNTLYILDEPTIGLHMTDVDKLLRVLRQLIAKGNTVVVIEHNLDVISQADYLLELGPGPGAEGGKILYRGSPNGLRNASFETPTKNAILQRSVKLLRLLSQQDVGKKLILPQSVSVTGASVPWTTGH